MLPSFSKKPNHDQKIAANGFFERRSENDFQFTITKTKLASVEVIARPTLLGGFICSKMEAKTESNIWSWKLVLQWPSCRSKKTNPQIKPRKSNDIRIHFALHQKKIVCNTAIASLNCQRSASICSQKLQTPILHRCPKLKVVLTTKRITKDELPWVRLQQLWVGHGESRIDCGPNETGRMCNMW